MQFFLVAPRLVSRYLILSLRFCEVTLQTLTPLFLGMNLVRELLHLRSRVPGGLLIDLDRLLHGGDAHLMLLDGHVRHGDVVCDSSGLGRGSGCEFCLQGAFLALEIG
jgi:hypothetical protein